MNNKRENGTALLAVLWLVAALSAIAFTVASTVRAETERASTEQDSLRAYHLAQGAVYRGILWIVWSGRYSTPDGRPMYFHSPMPLIHYEFPGGVADLEVIPEQSKLDINHAKLEELNGLLLALGTPAGQAQGIARAIVDWRTPTPGGGRSTMDAYYLSLTPSFQARHASFEEIEELLLVRGMTPEIFYGGFRPGPNGNLVSFGGLRDCVSVYGSTGQFDMNTVRPEILGMLGVGGDAIRQIMQMRAAKPFTSTDEIGPLLVGSRAEGHLRIGGGSITTLRATARLRAADGKLSDMKRSVSAVVKTLDNRWDPPFHILRWYSNATPAADVTQSIQPLPEEPLSEGDEAAQ